MTVNHMFLFTGMTAAQQQQQDNNHHPHNHNQYHHHHHQNYPNNFDTSMRKNANFRSTGSVQKSSTSTTINGAVGNNAITSAANSLTTLERTHIYNVDKKQVAIIDVGSNGGGNGGNGSGVDKKVEQTTTSSNNIVDNASIDEKSSAATIALVDSNLNLNTNNLASMESLTDCVPITVPPSPRGFDPKIKRPQIPAPPPPTNRPKSGELASADSTNL